MEHVLLASVVSKTMTPAPLLFQHLWVFFPEPSLCTHKKVLDSDDGRMLYLSTTSLAFSLSGHSHICGWHHCPLENIDMSQKNEYMLNRINCSLFVNNMSLQLSTCSSHGFPGYSVTKGRPSLRFASSQVKMRRWEEFEEGPLCVLHLKEWASQMMLVVKNLLAGAGDIRDAGLIPGLGRYPGDGHGNPRQYSCLEKPMGRGAWWTSLHVVAKKWTWLSDLAPTHLKGLRLVLILFFFSPKDLTNECGKLSRRGKCSE